MPGLKYNMTTVMTILLFGADVFMVIVFLLKISRLPLQIPLYYSQPWGESQLADPWMIFLLPIFLNSLFFINQYIFNRFYRDNVFIKNIFYYLNLFLIVSFTLIFVKIIFLVS